ncbi:MFS transporter [Streptomyces sp. NBC_01622]|uniref:MFS transporter n=1 Tax=Streptomyces sp. NBC_01622 TaxID=2975903 RepID=UPI003866B44E|nr:MFS transporter [Streptomyces sp. NBC_01622]
MDRHPHPAAPSADRRRWAVLAVGLLAMTAGCTFQFGLAYLIPALRGEGLSLGEAGLLAAAPTAGLLFTLVAWGAAADRWGERWVLAGGLALAGAVLAAANAVHGPAALGVCFLLAGAAGGSVHASSGRLILGWFAAHERGLAMGLRQTAQPLGVAVAAVALPTLAAAGLVGALVFLSAFCLVAAGLVAAFVRDPQRASSGAAERSGSPYRTPVLWRVHGSSALLIVPQFTVSTFALVFLVDMLGWQATEAGRVLAVAQIGGAAARLLSGWWSDRAGSRLRPMRTLTVAIAATVAALATASTTPGGTAVALVVIAAVVTVSTNGLAFTAVAEHAGNGWAGKALGIQNTAQNAVAAATPPVMAAVISGPGYPAAFGAAAMCALLAVAVIPVRAEGGTAARKATDAKSSDTAPRASHHPRPARP